MDLKGFAELAASAMQGKPPTADELAGVFSDKELARAYEARTARVSQATGETAVKTTVRAQIESMLPAAYDAYAHNVATINDGRRRGKVEKATEAQFTTGAMDALDEPTLDYMETVKDESKGETLWVPKSAPNVELSVEEMIRLAEVNAGRLGRPLWSWDGRAKFLGKFPAAVLSGNDPNSSDPVTHQFAPNTFTSSLYGTVAHQVRAIDALRLQHPEVDIHAPALAHSIGGWAIHADTGLAIPTNFNTTYDRAVDVGEPRPVCGFDDRFVPYSGVHGGVSSVDYSHAGGEIRGRAWVGSNSNLAA